jgi:hypothetical protein
MAGLSKFISFTCPNCEALYQLVKAEAGPETVDRQIACQVCDAPLPGREDGFILKYFFLPKAVRSKPRARGGSQPLKNPR